MRIAASAREKLQFSFAATTSTSSLRPTKSGQLTPHRAQVTEELRVAVASTAALPPEPLRLSALDAQWRLLIFSDSDDGGAAGGNTNVPPPFASAVASLRASLAETLTRFPPLAGRIVHLPDTGDAAFDCTAAGVAGGVRFIAAEMIGVDAARLAGEEEHDAEVFRRLVPELDAGELPAETMAAQVTRLRGGMAIGVAVHHAVVDGRSVWRFLEAWAAACRGGGEDDDDDVEPPPTFDRAAIELPSGEELARAVLRKHAPDLPKVRRPISNCSSRAAGDLKYVDCVPLGKAFPECRTTHGKVKPRWTTAAVAGRLVQPNLSRRTFSITARDMQCLKHRIADVSPTGHAATSPSSFIAVASLAWVSFVHAKHRAGNVSPNDEVYLSFFADCRTRLNPPPGDHYFGVCISGCLARVTARDLLAENGVGVAAVLVAEQVRRAMLDPLAGWDWRSTVKEVDKDRVVILSGSNKFSAYEVTDFGWGLPARTELVTMNHDGQVVLVAGKKGGDSDGGMQASVSLHPAHMGMYKSYFLSYFR
ncbi:hypothetical protein HU200_028822 [Digitaria exilis]|uniref:Uncharacterized protein n=1 Tax=Digitaria exilis TaxID=1010633 RepID=A0A835BW70_9POAL|nr:hypothetical protein HU200_028822 [Digitaria exilis]